MRDRQLLPQLERGIVRLGGAKVLYQRSGIIARMITMLSAMSAAWSTTPALRDVFGSFLAFGAAAGVALVAWMVFDYVVLFPSEQRFNQGQSQRAERSPLKQDTEEILDRVEKLHPPTAADGGESDESA